MTALPIRGMMLSMTTKTKKRAKARKFDPTKPLQMTVKVTPGDWAAGRAARDSGSFYVCRDCAAGQAINRTFRERFPGAKKISATCAEGSVTLRDEDYYRVMEAKDPPHTLDTVVRNFDKSRGSGKPVRETYPTLKLKFLPTG